MGASDQQQVDSLLQKSDEAFRKLPSDWQDKLGAVNVVGMSGESFTQYMEGVVDNWQKNGEVSAQEAQQLKDNYTGSTAIFDTSSNSMIINLDNPHSDGLAGTCLHEYAHAIDNYGAWATYAENDDYSSIYQKSLSLAGGADSESSRGFVSGYAKVNIGEDFAETVKVYYESGGNPAAITPDQNAQKLIQERFNFLEKNGIVSLSAR